MPLIYADQSRAFIRDNPCNPWQKNKAFYTKAANGAKTAEKYPAWLNAEAAERAEWFTTKYTKDTKGDQDQCVSMHIRGVKVTALASRPPRPPR